MRTFSRSLQGRVTLLLWGVAGVATAFVGLWAFGVVSVPVAQIRTLVALGTDVVAAFVVEAIPFAIILGVLLFAAWALNRYFTLRARDITARTQENEVELARLQGELVSALTLRLRQTSSENPQARSLLLQELERATERYQALLMGILRGRSGLAQVERDAITSYLDEALEQLKEAPAARTASWM